VNRNLFPTWFTTIEWLNTLPEPDKSEVLAARNPEWDNRYCHQLSEAIMYSGVFQEEKGYEYWIKIYKKYHIKRSHEL